MTQATLTIRETRLDDGGVYLYCPELRIAVHGDTHAEVGKKMHEAIKERETVERSELQTRGRE